MYIDGYSIMIYGHQFQKDIIFTENEPSETELEELIKEHGAVRAFVEKGKIFIIENDYVDSRGNKINHYEYK